MAQDPKKLMTVYDSRSRAVIRAPRPDRFPPGVFCASPTVLEAINLSLYERNLPTLWVQYDGTIGPTDPLLARIEYVPSPFFVM